MLGGAIRGFNLPLVLAGLIVGAMLMQWRVARRMVEEIDCHRRLPDEAFAGQPFSIRFLVANTARWMPAFLMRIDDAIVASGPAAVAVSASCGVGRVLPKRTVMASYDCLVTKRGLYEIGPCVISTGMPLGLMLLSRSITDIQPLWVFPRVLRLRRDWRSRLQNRSGGMATTARRSGAADGNFFGLRTWQTGDSRRWIHWRTTARIGEPAVRQFEQQRRFDLCILVDAYEQPSSSTQPHQAASDAIEFVISAAASIVTQMVATPTNRIALAVAGKQTAVIASGGSREQVNAIMRLLAELETSAQPDIEGAVEQVLRSVGRPQDLLILSPRGAPPFVARLTASLGSRSSVQWCGANDGMIDLLVERTGETPIRQRQVQ